MVQVNKDVAVRSSRYKRHSPIDVWVIDRFLLKLLQLEMQESTVPASRDRLKAATE